MQLLQTIVWRRLDTPGHDACGLWRLDDGWRLAGTAVFGLDGRPCRLSFEVICDGSWRGRSAVVDGFIGGGSYALRIAPASGGGWMVDGAEPAKPIEGPDLDLGFTPATNLTAIRRLDLRIGEEAAAPAVWLDFPHPKLVLLLQTYRRVDLHRYDYQSPSAGYAGQLEVTDLGFVTEYPDLWTMEALS